MRRSGFSLVELSIVLVILGLLAGGILTGQSLIRAAQLRAIPVEFQQFQTAVMSFQDKYRQLPGDMRNATDFFGAAATCPPTSAAPLTGRATCNGDGDGMIEHGAAGGTANERFTIWHHLVSAGLLEGSYTGATDDTVYSNSRVSVGINSPASKFGTGGWFIHNLASQIISSVQYIEGDYGHVLLLGAPVAGSIPYEALVVPSEAWNVDKKIDDGRPGTGKIVMYENDPQCYRLADGSDGVASASAARVDTTYDLAETNVFCAFILRDVF